MITLTSGADGSFLAADTQNNALVNVAADASSAAPQAAKFQVVDLGKGRVALKASNGRFVSVAGETAGSLGDRWEDLLWPVLLMLSAWVILWAVSNAYAQRRSRRIKTAAEVVRPGR